MSIDTPVKFKCAYCGSNQTWTGAGTPVCANCGASQPARDPSAPAPTVMRRRIGIIVFTLIAGIAVTVGVYVLLHKKPAAVVQTKPATPVLTGATTPPSTVSESRIVRVDNPKIRQIPKGAEFTADDLLKSANRPPSPPFDTHLLVVKTPRRMQDEEENQIYLGEVTNSSPNEVAIAPVAMLTIKKNGEVVDSAEHDFPDLAPGAPVPVFFRYDADPRSFDTIEITWKPTKFYTFADGQHAQLTATIASHPVARGSTQVNFTREYRYNYAKVTGTVDNQGQAPAKNIRLFVIARDARGQITGYERHDVGDTIAPGGSAKFEVNVTQWGNPIASVEAVASPTSPPGL
jgi:hypothetical protein